jgi:hypothetical protein
MFDRNIHKTILLQILKDIYIDASLGPILGFKGGTAANFFYDLGRFSVDLDFDLLNGDKEPFVFEKTEKILREYGTIKGNWLFAILCGCIRLKRYFGTHKMAYYERQRTFSKGYRYGSLGCGFL